MIPKNLNDKQLEAVNFKDGPLLIVAGAGSGKTKVLTAKIINLLEKKVPPENILAITFTNKAANEMKKRVGKVLNLQVSTFHSFGAKLLRSEAPSLKRTAHFTIFDDEDSLSLIKKIIKSLNLDKEKYKPAGIRYQISKIKSELKKEAVNDDVLQEIFKEYERLLVKNNAFDFDDLIEKPVKIFLDNPKILAKYQNRFQYVLVDEFQDTNTAQYQLVKLLCQKHRNLSVVGDDAQSIYGWRHADFRNFLNFEKDWPETKVVLLEENYRSSGNIVQSANQVIKNNAVQKQKNLWTMREAGESIKVAAAETEEDEADWVAEEIHRLLAGGNNIEEIAVLYRTNAQSRAVEQALLANNLPYKIFGGVRFYERKEIKDIMAGLRLSSNPQDEISRERLEKNFSKKKSAYLVENLPRLARELTVVQLINYVINNTGYLDYLENNFKNAEERAENIQELIKTAKSVNNLEVFLEKASLVQGLDTENGGAGVNLMTIHLAKGLEFDNVFVSGCCEGVLPHQKSYFSQESLEEERRLMYVAMTRARKRLFLSLNRIPSRFLHEIPPEMINFQSLSSKIERLPDEDEMWIEYG